MKFFRCMSGVSAIEFGLALPLLMLIVLGTIEIGRFELIHQKLDKTAHTMTDFLTQNSSVRFSDMDSYASSASQIMKPFGFDGSIIFSAAIFRDVGIGACAGSNASCITWQYTPRGGDASRVGTAGSNAVFPGGYSVLPGQVAISVEVYYNYSPLFPLTATLISSLGNQKIYKISVYKPRQVGTLINPPT